MEKPEYAKITVMGSPITKSNFKMHNLNGRAILPNNSGTIHDRYANYEQLIAYEARSQNPGVTFQESLIAVLRVYYKSEKRHPDTINITKSIFDGIEKSGLIVNDAQIRRIILEEYYDKVEPRFELELFAESTFRMSWSIRRHEGEEPIFYEAPAAKKAAVAPRRGSLGLQEVQKLQEGISKRKNAACGSRNPSAKEAAPVCSVCKKKVDPKNLLRADGGKTLICKSCFHKLLKR
ncbi:putative Zn-finger containing protein [Clostridiaceae bacterium JG1575]|nr:putative Zn-finger containing protein [Clostridiaceae bacterium JG1575]